MHTNLSLNNYQDILAHEQNGVILWNIIEDTVEYDINFVDLIGKEIPNEHFSDVLKDIIDIHPEDVDMLRQKIAFMYLPQPAFGTTVKDFYMDFRVRYHQGDYVWFHMHELLYYRDGMAHQVLCKLHNSDEEHRQKDALIARAQQDPMTGLNNKAQTKFLIEKILQESQQPHALLVIDMDGFKDVNDTLGHLTGDAVISKMALDIQEVFRTSDIIGRVGGDEFVVFLKNVMNREVIVNCCNRLRNLLRNTLDSSGKKLRLSGSIGIALSPEHGETYDELFAKADKALYQAKACGRDTQVFYSEKIKHKTPVNGKEKMSIQTKKSLLETPVEFIFKMLYETRDANLTVTIIMELFAKYFHVQRVYMHQLYRENYWSVDCIEWYDRNVSDANTAHEPILDIIMNNYRDTEYGRFSECQDATKMPPAEKKLLLDNQIHSFIHCAIMDGDDFVGCVGFDDAYNPRVWTKREKEILKVFADIMGNFLMQHAKIKYLEKRATQLRHIVEGINRYIIVIDPDTHEFLYMNKKATEGFNLSQRALPPCYELLGEKNGICKNCLVDSKDQTVHRIWNKVSKSWMHTHCFHIDWMDNTRAILIIAHP